MRLDVRSRRLLSRSIEDRVKILTSARYFWIVPADRRISQSENGKKSYETTRSFSVSVLRSASSQRSVDSRIVVVDPYFFLDHACPRWSLRSSVSHVAKIGEKKSPQCRCSASKSIISEVTDQITPGDDLQLVSVASRLPF